MTLDDLLAPKAGLGKMDDSTFEDYWLTLGHLVRVAAKFSVTSEKSGAEPNCTAASTERTWSRHTEAPATPRVGWFQECEVKAIMQGGPHDGETLEVSQGQTYIQFAVSREMTIEEFLTEPADLSFMQTDRYRLVQIAATYEYVGRS